jgi:predicted DNA-binding transcriptional regulator YafY
VSRAPRLLDLVQLLDTRYGRTRDELVENLGVSERTLYRDLACLTETGIPVVAIDGRYRLVDGAAWHPVILSSRERATLRLLLGAKGLRAAPDLATRLGSLASKLTRLTEGGEGALVLADRERTGPVPAGLVEMIEDAVARQATVEAAYVSLSSGGPARRRRIDPWAIFHRDEAWYLAGWCHERQGPRIFRLDRIRHVRQTGDLFLRPEGFDVDAWLASAWSLYSGGEPREIVIHFAPSLAPLVENARHHEGERVTRLPDGSAEYRVTLGHIEEIARWIAAFGGKAKAIAPEELVERVTDMAAGLLAAHERVTTRRPAVAARTVRAPKKKKHQLTDPDTGER